MEYRDFFNEAYGNSVDPDFGSYNYQRRLAEAAWPDLLDVPTGMGKTAAVVLAWLWKRGWRRGSRQSQPDIDTPRRLIYCLPMRVLVEQTVSNVEGWLKALGIHGKPGEGNVSVNVLMGGEEDARKAKWTSYPEEDSILIGTQDMLLSRALMRGYGMSRFNWPIHFALLHNDALWVFDEVQLMGAGLATSAQLEAFRRAFPPAKSSRTLWVSATMKRSWLDTVDLHPDLQTLTTLTIDDQDREQAADRLRADKPLLKASFSLSEDTRTKAGLWAYLQALSALVLEGHDPGAQTLVIVNRVERAQELFRLLRKMRPGKPDLLIHARFRAAERAEQVRRLREDSPQDRIIVSTQATEAGVDISSKTLITELAPWPSLVQRFGRCNRYGEHNAPGACIRWINIADDEELSLPYDGKALSDARERLGRLDNARPQNLLPVDPIRPVTSVLRRRDLLDLFNTDPDLSGFDVDVSDYIRDDGPPSVLVFWRNFKDDPNHSGPDGGPERRPDRSEVCPISMSQAKDIHQRGAWRWDSLGHKKHGARWVKLDRQLRPGMTLLLRASDGGYDEIIGFNPAFRKPVSTLLSEKDWVTRPPEDAFGEDPSSQQFRPVALSEHLAHVARHASELCAKLGETSQSSAIVRAGRWHDLGKAHTVFQRSMYRCKAEVGQLLLSKSDCQGRMHHERPYFRHELASTLGWLEQHDGEVDADLVAYLIVAHHGKVRMSLRSMPDEEVADGVTRFARGVWEGDTLPSLDLDGEHSREVTLRLALMEIGESEQGPSWTERTLELLNRYGPFQLAWLETLVRLADWRASAEEQE